MVFITSHVEGFGRSGNPFPSADLHRGRERTCGSAKAFYKQCHQFPQLLSYVGPVRTLTNKIWGEMLLNSKKTWKDRFRFSLSQAFLLNLSWKFLTIHWIVFRRTQNDHSSSSILNYQTPVTQAIRNQIESQYFILACVSGFCGFAKHF